MRSTRLPVLLSLVLGGACEPVETAPQPAPAGQEVAPVEPAPRPAGDVAELTAVRGAPGVRADDLPEGTFLGAGARLRAGQRLVVPPGALAELRLTSGALLRLNEGTRLTLPGGASGESLALEGGELVAIVASGQPPLGVRAGADVLEVAGGEARALSRGERRSYDMVHGTARLRSGGREVALSAGAHVDTPLPAASERPLEPDVGLRALADTAWSRAFEVAAARVDAAPPGVGSLTARRAGTTAELHRLALTEQKVHVAISGRIARTEVEQTFYNESSEVLEGTYRFPLPADASISGLSLLVGDAWMDAEMLEKQRAREIFREIVDATIPRDPALLEWEHGNTFRMKIFPIPGRGARKIRLSYTQVLPVVGDALRYRYPLAGASSGAAGEEIGEFEFDVAVDRAELPDERLAAVVTPMAELDRRVLADRVELSTRKQRFRPVHDLGVDLPLPAADRRLHAETFLDRDGQAYFMLAFRPDIRAPAGDRPVHYAFVLDRSHSTTPELWTVARGLVAAMAAALDGDDRMTVLACDAACDAAPGGLAPAAAAMSAADAFLDAQSLAGASDIGGMMRAAAEALRPDGDPGAAERVIVYLGDGNASAGELAPDELLRHLAAPLAGVRVQAVALGARSDLLLLDALARDTGGDVLRADAQDDLGGLVRELRLRAEVPPIRQVELTLPPEMVEVHPRELAALRPGETVTLVGKLRGPARGAIELKAAWPSGYVVGDMLQIDLDAAPGAASSRHAHLPRTWARLEIDDLTATRGHAARADIVALSRQYTVLSRYTALIALESEAMYREFGVAREAGSTTGWDGRLADPAKAAGSRATKDEERVDYTPRPEPAEEPDEASDSPADEDDRARASGAGGLGQLGGIGSGYGSGAGSSSGYGGGFGGRGDRLRPRWTLDAADPPGPSQLARLETMREAVQRDPTSRPAHRKLVLEAIRIGAPDAFTYATAWAQADPDHAPALLAVADLLAARGDPLAPRAYGSAVEVDPFDAKKQARLADAYAFKGDHARSCAHRRAVVSVDPARADNHVKLARCLAELGRPELVRAAAEDGLARARGSSAELRAALSGQVPEDRLRVTLGDLTAHASWTGEGDLDVALVDRRGRRLSGLRREGVVVVQKDSSETAALSVGSPQTFAVEVTRHGGQGPVQGRLQITAGDAMRTFPFTIEQGSVRVASATYHGMTHEARVEFVGRDLKVNGALSRDIVRRIVRAHSNEVRYCYHQALQRDPGARGRVTVGFVIGEDGKVITSNLQKSTMRDASVGACITGAVRRWSFPRPESGVVTVTYPIVLGD